jgi:hypothetical protein
MLFKVIMQKPVVGKSEPKEAELIRNRRVVVVEVNKPENVGMVLRAYGEDVFDVVRIEPAGQLVVLSP